jgi:hypothetical protein
VEITPFIPLTLRGRHDSTKYEDVVRGFSLVQCKGRHDPKGSHYISVQILNFGIYLVFGF